MAILRTQKHPYRFIHPSIGGSNDSKQCYTYGAIRLDPTYPSVSWMLTSCWCFWCWNFNGIWVDGSLKKLLSTGHDPICGLHLFFSNGSAEKKKHTHQPTPKRFVDKNTIPYFGGLSLFPVKTPQPQDFANFFSARESQPKPSLNAPGIEKQCQSLGSWAWEVLIVVRITSHGNPAFLQF